MAHAPLSWIKQIHDALEEVKEIPLWGFFPEFPLETCSQKIAEMLNLSELKITLENTRLRSAGELTTGLGMHPVNTTLHLTPLSEPAYWLMAQEDIAKLITLTLSQHSGKGFTTASFQEGFYRFLGLLIAEGIDQLNAFGDLSVKLSPTEPLPKEQCLCIDVSVQLPKQPIWGRIVLPAAFRHAFKAHFSRAPLSLAQSPLAATLDLTLSAEVGRSKLRLSQWDKIAVGDFVVLDDCSFDPSSHKGGVTLTLNAVPLIRARLKGESLKIVDYAFYNEEIMNENLFADEDKTPEEEMPQESDASSEESHLWSEPDAQTPVEERIAKQDIELPLTVEVAKLKISLQKLLNLRPGNILELPVHPEQGVEVSLGGKKIAKAELIKLGDILGIKILQIYT